MPEDDTAKEKSQMKKEQWEKMMLRQIANLLVTENLINPEEQIRFLSLVEKGE